MTIFIHGNTHVSFAAQKDPVKLEVEAYCEDQESEKTRLLWLNDHVQASLANLDSHTHKSSRVSSDDIKFALILTDARNDVVRPHNVLKRLSWTGNKVSMSGEGKQEI